MSHSFLSFSSLARPGMQWKCRSSLYLESPLHWGTQQWCADFFLPLVDCSTDLSISISTTMKITLVGSNTIVLRGMSSQNSMFFDSKWLLNLSVVNYCILFLFICINFPNVVIKVRQEDKLCCTYQTEKPCL